MRIFLTGASGLLGGALLRRLSRAHEVDAPGSAELDVADRSAVDAALTAARPELVIHCAALADVDACERDPARAHRVNAGGTGAIGGACARLGARLIALSTDYVFSGADGAPYAEEAAPDPINAYGASKLAGERAALAAGGDATVVRVSWLFGVGGRGFVPLMRRLAGESGPPVRAPDDQRSVPTSVDAVVTAIAALIDRPAGGIVHLVCAGDATRLELATAVFNALGSRRPLVGCASADLDDLARRPRDSRLANLRGPALGLPPMPHWRDELARLLRGG